MRPQDTFSSDAIIKITLPTQVYVGQDCNVSGGTTGIVDIFTARVEVRFNRIIYITDAFPNGMQTVNDFTIELTSFTNPPTTQPTDSFEIKIFYEENTNEVSTYTGNEMTFTAEPSTALQVGATLTELLTGQTQT